MYSIVEIGGKQYIVGVGDTIVTEKINVEKNTDYIVDKVLLVKQDSGEIKLGTPYVQDVKVVTEVLNHIKSRKIVVLRKGNSKKNWRRKYGHRQQLTILKVKEIKM
ncbi:MAG: 50S ribosomal protein L21 [Endomicrobia bacterium]|nr:50S ribosomal protein L21 [Endomicrobiia bacterium]